MRVTITLNDFVMCKMKPEENDDVQSRVSHSEKITCICQKIICGRYFRLYLGIILIILQSWAILYAIVGAQFTPSGYLFKLFSSVLAGYVIGRLLEKLFYIPSMVGMMLTGIVLRYLSWFNARDYPLIDQHLRKVYAVVILTKGALGWDYNYIKLNIGKVMSLTILPWTIDCLTMAVAVTYLLGFDFVWGLRLGSIMSSVSPAVILPAVSKLRDNDNGVSHEVLMLVTCAGGLDTALTEGVFGIIDTAMFVNAQLFYKIVKIIFTIFIGIVAGVIWGHIVYLLPLHNDKKAVMLKCLLLLFGGVCGSYIGILIGWGGVAGVAIMFAAATAATIWSKKGWKLSNNPVAETYRVFWNLCEPFLFTLTGSYFDISTITLNEFGLSMSCLTLSLIMRLLTAFIVCYLYNFSVAEAIFVCFTWIPKTIVEAVLVSSALDTVNSKSNATTKELYFAETQVKMIIPSIIFTSTIGYLLTKHVGKSLLQKNSSETIDTSL